MNQVTVEPILKRQWYQFNLLRLAVLATAVAMTAGCQENGPSTAPSIIADQHALPDHPTECVHVELAANKLLEEAITAHGGYKKLKEVKFGHISHLTRRPGTTIPPLHYEIDFALPDRLKQVISWGPEDTRISDTLVWNGRNGCFIPPNGEPHATKMQNPTQDSFPLSVITTLLKAKAATELELLPEELCNQRKVYPLLTSHQGQKVTLFFDRETKLLAGWRTATPEKQTYKTILSDYQIFDGVALPMALSAEDSNSQVFMTTEVTAFESTDSIDDSFFLIPSKQ